MPLERFIPKSPDPFIRNSQDFEVAKFGHLNTIIEYVNTYVVTDSLQLSGTGPLTSTARYITDSIGTNSSLAISTGNIGIGTTNPIFKLSVNSGISGVASFIGNSLPTNFKSEISIGDIANSRGFSIGIDPFETGNNVLYFFSTETAHLPVAIKSQTLIIGNYDVSLPAGMDTATGLYMRVVRQAIFRTSGGLPILKLATDGTTQLGNETPMNARLGIKGSGSTSATTSLLVQDSSGTQIFKTQDDGQVIVNKGNTQVTFAGAGGIAQISAPNELQIGLSANPTSLKVFYDGRVALKNSALLIDTSDRVGIGTTAPATKLEVSGIGSILQLTNSSNNRNFSFNPSYATLDYGGLFTHSTGNITLGASVGTDNGSQIGLYLGGVSGERIAKLQVKGNGSTSATTSLLVQNSAGNRVLSITDDQYVTIQNPNNTECFQVLGSGVGASIKFTPSGGTTSIVMAAQSSGLILSTTANDFADVRATGASQTLRLGTNNLSGGGVNYYASLNGVTGYHKWFFNNVQYAQLTIAQFVLDDSGTLTRNDSAILQANSTTKGFLPPRMSTTQRTGIVLPAAGLIVYDTDTNKSYTYDGTAWQAHW